MPDISPEQASAAAEEIAERLTRRALLGARYDASLARDIVSMLVDLERDLAGQIAEMDITGVSRLSARRQRLESLLEMARKAVRKTYRRITVLAETQLDELFSIEAGASREIMRAAFQDVGVRLGVSLPSSSYMAALAEETLVMGRPLSSWWAGQEASLREAFAREMRLGLQAGETVQQLTRRIRGGKRDGLPVKGIMATSRAHAVAMARTSAAGVGNGARFATFEANLDVIQAYVHLSRLDLRTSEQCILRAGKRWDAKTKAPLGHRIPFQLCPIHHGCRSVHVVQVIGGEPPTNQNGEAWFKGLSAEEQGHLFGAGRMDLFRSGDMSMSELFDQSGRPISLSDLRTARERPGDRTARRI
jgi:hypothetical protein